MSARSGPYDGGRCDEMAANMSFGIVDSNIGSVRHERALGPGPAHEATLSPGPGFALALAV